MSRNIQAIGLTAGIWNRCESWSEQAQSVLLYALALVPAALRYAGGHGSHDPRAQHLGFQTIVTDPTRLSQTCDLAIGSGGTTGLVLASWLLEDSKHTVPRHEAGDTGDSVTSSIRTFGYSFCPLPLCVLTNLWKSTPSHSRMHLYPLVAHSLLRAAYDWGRDALPRPYTGNCALYWPRRKVLGGSSLLSMSLLLSMLDADSDDAILLRDHLSTH